MRGDAEAEDSKDILDDDDDEKKIRTVRTISMKKEVKVYTRAI